MTAPDYLKDNKRAKAIFRSVVNHLKENGRIEKVDADMIALYATSIARYELLEASLLATGYVVNDSKGSIKKRPEVTIQKQMFDQSVAAAKALGIDRNFRQKGREQSGALGKTTDKIGRLRKVG